MLTKEDLQKSTKLAVEEVDVPEWGGKVLVRELTARERNLFEASLTEGQGKKKAVSLDNISAKLVVRALVDEEGNRILSDADADWLGSRSAAALYRVFEVARRLSGMTQEDVEDYTKN